MTEWFTTQQTIVMDRRKLLAGLAAGSVFAVSGCTTNPVTGRSQLIMVSEGQLAQLSASSWTQIKGKESLSRDPAYTGRVKRVAPRIVNAAGLGAKPWEFAVFDSDQINAFAMPGGKIGVYTGILDVMENDDQLATVLGHEVGHITGRHGQERYSQSMLAGVGMQTASVALASNDVAFSRELAAVIGAGISFGVILPYARKHEYEADRIGLKYMQRAGYDPHQSVKFWQNMMAKNQGRQKPPEFMSTHPSDSNRIAELQKAIREMGA